MATFREFYTHHNITTNTVEVPCRTDRIGAVRTPGQHNGDVARETHWHVTFTRTNSVGHFLYLAFEYSQGSGLGKIFNGRFVPSRPDPWDVLCCLQSDVGSIESSRGFSEWANEMGYLDRGNKNPIASYKDAKATYKACKATRKGLKAFFTREQYTEFMTCTEE